jgi:cytochrome c-type biogenesis protein CcmH
MVGLLLLAVVVAGMVGGDASADERARAIGARVKCPVCQGVSIVDSPSETARAMMAVVGEKVAEGWSDGQILEYFSDRYGPGIVIDPPVGGRTLVLWLLPVAALAVGAAMIWTRRRTKPVERTAE